MVERITRQPARTCRSIADSPPVAPVGAWRIVAIPQVGGLQSPDERAV
jgi:hypothetical protein